MSFANCQMGGMNMASPDVCKTPSPPGAPVPIPYPNIAQGATANPGTAVQKVLISGAPAHTIQTIIPMSSGDEAGVVGGVVSSMIMGPCRHLMGATNVLIGGMPATKMGDPTGQNGMSMNISGSTSAPAQTKVMLNSGGGGGGGGASNNSNQQEESKKPQQQSIKNPRWEHADQNVAEKRADSTIIGDNVRLKVDVTNIPDGTSVTFKVYDTAVSPPIQIATVYGKATGGIGTGVWRVSRLAKLAFDGKVRTLTSEKEEIPVSSVWVFSF